MPLFPRLKPFLRLAVLGSLAGLAGCGLFEKNDASNNANKDAAQYRERPIEQIYADAWRHQCGQLGTGRRPVQRG